MHLCMYCMYVLYVCMYVWHCMYVMLRAGARSTSGVYPPWVMEAIPPYQSTSESKKLQAPKAQSSECRRQEAPYNDWGSVVSSLSGVWDNVPSKLRARARTTFRLARTAFPYWRTIGIGHECYCSRGRPMRAPEIKLEGTRAFLWRYAPVRLTDTFFPSKEKNL